MSPFKKSGCSREEPHADGALGWKEGSRTCWRSRKLPDGGRPREDHPGRRSSRQPAPRLHARGAAAGRVRWCVFAGIARVHLPQDLRLAGRHLVICRGWEQLRIETWVAFVDWCEVGEIPHLLLVRALLPSWNSHPSFPSDRNSRADAGTRRTRRYGGSGMGEYRHRVGSLVHLPLVGQAHFGYQSQSADADGPGPNESPVVEFPGQTLRGGPNCALKLTSQKFILKQDWYCLSC